MDIFIACLYKERLYRRSCDMGYLLTFEAPDASGKSTQVNELTKRLEKDGYTVKLVRFPNYGSDACKPCEMYLHGVLGNKPEDVNAYSASVLFAVDRMFSYALDWKKDLENPNTVVILDRYTTSNAIHQLAKIDAPHEKEAFLDWLYDFEFNKLSLPVPDDTIFLDVKPSVSALLLAKRAENDKEHYTDIHEADKLYLKKCYDAAIFAAEKKDWKKINCTDGEKMRTIDDISNEIYAYVKNQIEILNKKGSF